MSVVLAFFLIFAAVAAIAQQSPITSGTEQLPDAPSSVVSQKAGNGPATSLSKSSQRFLNLASTNRETASPLIFAGNSKHAVLAGSPNQQSADLSVTAWNCASSATEKAGGSGWFNSLLNIANKNQHYCALGEGGFWRRGTYAMTQAFAAHKNEGTNSFNGPQTFASVAATDFASGYSAYPAYANRYNAGERMAARYATAVGRDTLNNMFREFWPDISSHVRRQRP